jgi:serine protease Do
MIRAKKGLCCGPWICAIAVALWAWAQAGAADPPAGQPEAKAASSADPLAAAEQFAHPDLIVRRFSHELTRLAERNEAAPTADLIHQLETRETSPVETVPDPGRKLAAEELYARSRPGVVILGALTKGEKRSDRRVFCATAFVVRKDGVLVTNYHLIATFQDMWAVGVMTDDGRVFPVKEVLAGDRINDVAVLKIAATNLTPLPMAASAPIGATIYCLSHPALNTEGTENAFFALTPGLVCGKYRICIGGAPAVNVLAVTTDYAKGSSGGPILNEHGAVVGIACQAIPVYHAEDQLDVQMVWKFARPVSSILPLLRGRPAAEKP